MLTDRAGAKATDGSAGRRVSTSPLIGCRSPERLRRIERSTTWASPRLNCHARCGTRRSRRLLTDTGDRERESALRTTAVSFLPDRAAALLRPLRTENPPPLRQVAQKQMLQCEQE